METREISILSQLATNILLQKTNGLLIQWRNVTDNGQLYQQVSAYVDYSNTNYSVIISSGGIGNPDMVCGEDRINFTRTYKTIQIYHRNSSVWVVFFIGY